MFGVIISFSLNKKERNRIFYEFIILFICCTLFDNRIHAHDSNRERSTNVVKFITPAHASSKRKRCLRLLLRFHIKKIYISSNEVNSSLPFVIHMFSTFIHFQTGHTIIFISSIHVKIQENSSFFSNARNVIYNISSFYHFYFIFH